jgi:hypothetical protein
MTSQASAQMGPAGDCSTLRWVLGKHRHGATCSAMLMLLLLLLLLKVLTLLHM